MKKSFSLFEIILVILIITLLANYLTFKFDENKLYEATNRLVIYLKQTRYQALIDSKEEKSNPFWHKKRWTLKFLRCREDVGGLYYVIYSDTNMTGHPSLDESLLDPLSNKRVYSTNQCELSSNTSKYVLLTKEFGIEDINVSCNETTSLGQISFGNDGNVYTKLSNYEFSQNDYRLENSCEILLKSQNNELSTIIVEPKTGFIYIKNQ